MASIFSHALTSYAFGQFVPHKKWIGQVSILGALSAMLPDIDILAFNFGISDERMLGHRGLTHSIPFAFFWSVLLVFIFHLKDDTRAKLILGLFYFICMVSHGILDAMTTGGEGIAFFAPFSAERYFLPWRIIKVSPIGASNFFSEWGVKVLLNEGLIIGLPSLILIIIGKYFRKKYD